MYKTKKAFTLAEILIALIVLGMLLALLIPHLSGLIADKRRQVTANSYTKVYTDIENAIEEYSLISYSSPKMFVNLSESQIIDALQPYLRIVNIDAGNNEFTLYDQTIVKVGKSTVDFDRDEVGTEYADDKGNNANTSVVVFSYQRPNTFIAQTIYTENGNTYLSCKKNCETDEVFKLMSSTNKNDTDRDGNSLKSNRRNMEIKQFDSGLPDPTLSKFENDDKE